MVGFCEQGNEHMQFLDIISNYEFSKNSAPWNRQNITSPFRLIKTSWKCDDTVETQLQGFLLSALHEVSILLELREFLDSTQSCWLPRDLRLGGM